MQRAGVSACERLDEAVDTWYKETGEPSDRVRLDPKTGEPYATVVPNLLLSSITAMPTTL